MRNKRQIAVDLQIPFHDVDMMEVVWHGHYIKYFEIARCALLDSIGYNYAEMRDSGFAWPVIDVAARYVKPAVFGQTVTVKATVAEWENRLKINYLVADKVSGVRLAKGHTVQVAVDMRDRTLCFESPRILLEKLGLKAAPEK